MIREDVYQKNLKIIFLAIHSGDIAKTERMICEEIWMSKQTEAQEKKQISQNQGEVMPMAV